jgi:hypothetical protein
MFLSPLFFSFLIVILLIFSFSLVSSFPSCYYDEEIHQCVAPNGSPSGKECSEVSKKRCHWVSVGRSKYENEEEQGELESEEMENHESINERRKRFTADFNIETE